MATSKEYIEFVCEQLDGIENVTYKKMFGEKLTEPQNIKIEYTSISGRVKVRDMFYGFYNVKEAENAK